MPVDWSLYPKDWPEIAHAKKEASGWKCEACGRECRRPGEPFDTHVRTLTVHHRDQDPGHNDAANLVALCPHCHFDAHRELQRLARIARKEADGQERLFR